MSVEDHLLSASPHNYALYFLASTNKLGGHHPKVPAFEQVLSESFSSSSPSNSKEMGHVFIDLEMALFLHCCTYFHVLM